MTLNLASNTSPASVTQNTCKMCAPLGACLAFRGIEGAMPLIHGSQGCATYIRRHLIGHFREPIDIASSSFTEQTAIFGGQENLFRALDNVSRQYAPQMIGIASSCLSETLGEDIGMMLSRYRQDHPQAPAIIFASTPSYSGTHATGFHTATRALVESFASDEKSSPNTMALFPGMLSCEDLRLLKKIGADFGINIVLTPDYSETLDAPVAETYASIPPGGTPLTALRGLGSAAMALTFGLQNTTHPVAAQFLETRFHVPQRTIGLPIGIEATDRFVSTLTELTERPIPDYYVQTRGRLIDAYVDAHKYLFDARVVICGEENLVVGLTRFVTEIGARPVVVATGGRNVSFREEIARIISDTATHDTAVLENADFAQVEELSTKLKPELIIGDSHGYAMSRRLHLPLVRVGFPIHDRIGAQRLLHVGYEGTQQLFDRIVNALLQTRQDASPVGYQHM